MKEPVIITKPAMSVIGIETRTTNALEMSGQGSIGALWQRYYEHNESAKIPYRANPTVTFGLYTRYANGVEGEYSVVAGVEVAGSGSVPQGMTAVQVPAGTYAVFTSARGPMVEVVIAAWQTIWAWSAAHPEIQRAFACDFEVYDERCANPEDAQVDIYIGLKE